MQDEPKKPDIDVIAEKDMAIPTELPLLPVRDIVVFPFMILPLFVGRPSSIKAVEKAIEKDKLIMLSTQKDQTVENPKPDELYNVGTVAMIMRMLKLPDGRIKILIQGVGKANIIEYTEEKNFYKVKIELIKAQTTEDNIPDKEIPLEIEALMRNVKEQSENILSLRGVLSSDIMAILNSINNPGRLADLVASNLRLNTPESQIILETIDDIERLKLVNEHLRKELEVSTMQAKIQSVAKEEIGKTQRDYFLREQMRAIKKELGDFDERSEEIDEYKEKISKARMPKEVEQETKKHLARFEQMHPDAAEASMLRTYVEWLVELPWSKTTRDKLDIKEAQNILDEDHYNLKKVKDRILEYLAVRKLNKNMKGPILCFVGPPGVGKTSLGRSIAKAMGRKFIRISLGGLRDEAEIRGHRRTYIGALPGRIIQSIKQAGSNNPVFMMDEIDKIGSDFRGDPSSALLEVLDPEQNNSFSDNYLNLPFDLSKVMFITTANHTDTIPSALLDRMEIIEISGYTDEEKLKIANKYLNPRQIKENGLKKIMIDISDQTILKIINQYTFEAGLRNLEREIGTICRKIAKKIAEGEKPPFKVTKANLHKYLGIPSHFPEEELESDLVGVSTGLAWTQAGGDILRIEACIMPGKGNLTITGQLGDVMRESAQAALSYARTLSKDYNIPENYFEEVDIHIHVPAGAIPKDGPSAGVTMTTALISAITSRPVRRDLAMTGEITLRGRVMPIGGLKEKSLAALRAKIKTIIVPSQNKKDIEEVPNIVKKKLKIITVETMKEILNEALLEPIKPFKKIEKSSKKSKIKKSEK